MTVRRLALVLPILALSTVACDRAVEDPVAPEGDAGAADPSDGTDADPEPDAPSNGDDADPSDDEAEGGYAILGRTVSVAEAATNRGGLTHAGQAVAEEGCPFVPSAEPCNADVCMNDPGSAECKDIIEAYCDAHPEDPGCDHDSEPGEPPPPDGEPGGKEPPPDGETWACEEDPSWPPCEVCLDPDATDEACGDAWNAHCSEHPEDAWCEHDDDEPEAVYMPSSLSVLVHQVEFSLADDCSDPILVGTPEEPHYVDFTDGPELVDATLPPEGTYACVIITMSDHIQWSVDGDNPCAGDHVQDVSGEDGTEETVKLYLSTAGDSGHDGNDAFEAPGLFLGGALEVGEGIVASEFVVSFPDGVWYRPDRERACEIREPEFAFQTAYAE
ncbi:MAG: hypothetical protein ACE37F_07870 [Nannocystaceae bacterium]|nr:hypothetical protein [bacterium]